MMLSPLKSSMLGIGERFTGNKFRTIQKQLIHIGLAVFLWKKSNRKEKNTVKKIRSYTSVWSLEKMLYAFGDITLPFATTFMQIAWCLGVAGIMVFLGDLPPLSFIDNTLIKFGVIPIGTAWFMGQKTFDGKKPHKFLMSVISYALRQKLTYAGTPIKMRKEKSARGITAVRSKLYEVSEKSPN